MTEKEKECQIPVKIQSFSVPIVLEVGVRKKRKYYLNLNGYR
jgi:hypothetical protein